MVIAYVVVYQWQIKRETYNIFVKAIEADFNSLLSQMYTCTLIGMYIHEMGMSKENAK